MYVSSGLDHLLLLLSGSLSLLRRPDSPLLLSFCFFFLSYRCHRIGQTRDVHVYRLVSEHSIEENIWRKQLQKRLLDEVVVDQGLFTMENTRKELNLSALDQEMKTKKDEKATQEWFSTSDTLKELLASPVSPVTSSLFSVSFSVFHFFFLASCLFQADLSLFE